MILLWGTPAEDPPLAQVADALRELGELFLLADGNLTAQMHLELALCGTRATGLLYLGAQAYPLENFRAVYVRSQPVHLLPGEPTHAQLLTELFFTWLELTEAKVLNLPEAMASNDSKPLQLALIRAHLEAQFGLEPPLLVPPTLITTDPEAVRTFDSIHGPLIYKSISGTRSIVTRFGPEAHGRLEEIQHCPTQFQAWIPGTDYRVHVAGDQLFACRVTTGADDYRYAAPEDPARMEACTLPEEVAAACLHLSRALALPLAGLDLRLTPAGTWFCFEVNPSPAFSWFADRTGQPIAGAIARLLASAPPLLP